MFTDVNSFLLGIIVGFLMFYVNQYRKRKSGE